MIIIGGDSHLIDEEAAGTEILDDFDIDTTAGTVTCPAGVTVTLAPARRAAFGSHCATCPVRHSCATAAGGRVIILHPHHDLLARRLTRDGLFPHGYTADGRDMRLFAMKGGGGSV